MSPFQKDVIDTTLNDFDIQAQKGMQGIADRALAVGAFGGGREGVQRAEFQAASDRNRAALQAQLLSQGFGQAQQAAAQAFAQQQNLAAQQQLSQQQQNLASVITTINWSTDCRFIYFRCTATGTTTSTINSTTTVGSTTIKSTIASCTAIWFWSYKFNCRISW